MAGGYGTDVAVMQKAASQIRQTSDEINGELRSLLALLEPLASQWRGEAATAFQQLIERWQQDANKLTQALGGIADGMSSSSSSYSSSEEANRSQIANIMSGLG
jgi:WXG100 family type VII secretion target